MIETISKQLNIFKTLKTMKNTLTKINDKKV